MKESLRWDEGAKFLYQNVAELRPLIDKYPPCTLTGKSVNDFFGILSTGIIAQQLPPEVSQSLTIKLETLLGKPITAEAVEKISVNDISELGISQQKAVYLKDFATAVLAGKITLDRFFGMTDAEITKQLLQVRGLGQWTIEMFLLLALARTDIVPTADFIFKKELQKLLHLQELPKRGQINKLTEHWRPWRSLAVWYMWQAAADDKNI